MRRMRHCCLTPLLKQNGMLVVGLLVGIVLGSPSSEAQYTANHQTNIISGVTNNWSGDYYVGSNYVFDALLIQNGGVLSNMNGYIGYSAAASNNSALVTGSGSVWSNETYLYVGDYGSRNSLVISNGGKVMAGDSYIGYNSASSNNSVLVTGTNSAWGSSPAWYRLYVGYSGSRNSLIISNGGTVVSSGYLGYPYGNNNSILVTGPGSVWNGDFSIGSSSSNNSLVISNGGKVVGDSGFGIGGKNNSALVTGNGSALTNTEGMSSFYVGSYGSGNSLVISNGGTVAGGESGFIGYGSIDYNDNSNNTVLVTGPGSVWTNYYFSIYVGYYGNGNSLVITNGGKVFNGNGDIGYCGNNNNVLVSGSGSIWNSRSITVDGGGGSLIINNGGRVVSSVGYIGYGDNNNSVLVSGSGSVWTNSSDVYVGYYGSGNSLVITNGGKVFDINGDIGYCGNNNNVLVSGSGSVWSNSYYLHVGDYSSGNSLVISNGGTVMASNLFIGTYLGSSNNFIALDGGTITTCQLFATNGANNLVSFNGGSLITKSTTVNNGMAFVVGDGINSAILTLTNGGTGIHSFNNGLVISGNATLNGVGTVLGAVTVKSGGTLAPGNGVGTLTISSNLVVNNGAVLQYQLGNSNDLMVMSGNLTLGGTLNITDAGGFTTGTYTLFTYAGALTYNGLTIGTTPDSSLLYTMDTSTPGQVNLIVVVPPPVASFTGSPTIGPVPLAVTFTDTSTGTITNRFWDFGDGNTINTTATSVSHTYNVAGTNTVTLIVSGPVGVSTSTQTNYIMTGFPLAADFSANPTNGPAPLVVTFTDMSTGTITNRLWDFGDGGTSGDINPSHSYTSAGVYSVSLTDSGPYGTDTKTQPNLITVSPTSATWTNSNASGNWSDSSSWDPVAIPDYGSSVIFGTAGTTSVVDNISRTVSTVTFNKSADFFVSASGGASLTINNGITVTTNFTYMISAPVVLGAANLWSVSSGGALQVSGPISGTNFITETGDGTVILSGTNTYSGGTTVSNGTLLVNNTQGSGTGAGVVSVASGGTLGGSGTIGGPVTVNGTLAPGNSGIGTLTISNGLAVNNGAVLQYDLGSSSDRMVVSSNLTLGGTLNITDAGGFTAGTYTLFSYGGTLTYNGVTIGTAPSSYNYAINTNAAGQVKLTVAAYTADHQTNIINGETINWLGDYYVGSNYVFDALQITGGGVLSNRTGYIGYTAAAGNNSALVSGNGSVWRNSYDLYVGYSGSSNSLVISDGGKVVNSYGYLGYAGSSSNNSVIITGNGSEWDNEYLFIGNNGSGNSLVISNGGAMNSGYGGFLGGRWDTNSIGGNNSVLVTGSGSVWSNGYGVFIGENGSGNSLVISDGGAVVGDYGGFLGDNSSSSNNGVLVTGRGSVWDNGYGVFIGENGSGNSLVISDGGTVTSDYGCFLGDNSGSSNNSVLVTGSGSVWDNGDIFVGESGSGNSVVISDGGTVISSYDSFLGDNHGSINNSVLVTGNGSVWSNGYDVFVGYFGMGNSLVISNGGTVVSDTMYVGYNWGCSNNFIRLNGGNLIVTNIAHNGILDVRWGTFTINGGTATVDQFLAADANGVSSIVITNGGTLTAKTATISKDATLQFALGTNSPATARVVVNGNLTLCGTLNITDAGGFTTGTYTLFTYAGALTNNGLTIGTTPDASLSYTIDTNIAGQVNLIVAPPIPPMAGFTGSPTNGTVPLAVTFTDTSTGTVTNRFWDFGDGNSTNTRATSLSHEYYTAGTYTVRLTVSGPVGVNTTIRSNYIVVTNPPPPVASFTGSPTNGLVPLPVIFTDVSTGNITNRFWSFGDGNTTNTMATSMSHTYSVVGTNTVTLIVSGPVGVSTNTRTSYIVVTNSQPPVASFTGSPTNGLAPLIVTFTDTSTGNITNRFWNFGDGATTNTIATSMIHTYSTVGTNTVSLRVSGPLGTNTQTRTNYIVARGGTTNVWVNSTSGKWETATNWSLGQPSVVQAMLLITNANSKTVTIDAVTTNAPATLTISNLTISAPGSATNTLLLDNAGLAVRFQVLYALLLETNGAMVVNKSAVLASNSISIGNSGAGGRLIITNGGTLLNGYGYMGYNTSSSNNSVLVTGSGSVWSNQFDLHIGKSGRGNSLVINNGGRVANNNSGYYSYIGYDSNSSNNSVLVTDANSVWGSSPAWYRLYIGYNGSGNSLVISNGGTVVNWTSSIGDNFSSSSNSVLVTGSGSVWRPGSVWVGFLGSGNSLVISNGGTVVSAGDSIGYSSSNNSVLVTGSGSVWSNSTYLYIGGYSKGNSLVINNGGTVVSTNLLVGYYTGSSNNFITLNGGNLTVTNTARSGTLDVRRGAFTINSGTAAVNQFVATNGVGSVVTFNGGAVTLGNAVFSNAVLGFALGTNNHPVTVTSNLTLGGTLNITDAGGFATGTYTLFSYGGTLTYNGVTIGTAPSGYNYAINTNTVGQVNLTVVTQNQPSNPSPKFTANYGGSGRQFQLAVNGVAGQTYIVEASTNLPTGNWVPIFITNAPPNGLFQFIVPDASSYPTRFYRVVTP